MVERNPEYERAFKMMRLRQTGRRWLRRGGCFLVVLLWLACMLTPCFFVTLAVRKEIVYSRSDIPDHQYRIFLIEDPDRRGIGVVRGGIKSGGEDEKTACVAISVDYFLWESEGESVDYCNCYEKAGNEWVSTVVGGASNCQPLPTENDPDQP